MAGKIDHLIVSPTHKEGLYIFFIPSNNPVGATEKIGGGEVREEHFILQIFNTGKVTLNYM